MTTSGSHWCCLGRAFLRLANESNPNIVSLTISRALLEEHPFQASFLDLGAALELRCVLGRAILTSTISLLI